MRSLLALLSLGLAFVGPTLAYAAVTVDFVSSTQSGFATPSTHAHTISGTQNILVVAVTINSTATVTGITYASQPLTNLPLCTVTPSDTFARTEVWFKTNPAAGTNNVVTSLTQGTSFVVRGVSFSGALTTAVAANFACVSNTGTGTTPTVTITSTAGELVLDALGVSIGGSETAVVGAGQTQRVNMPVPGSFIAASSTEAGAASVVMSWDISQSQPWAIAALRIPIGGAPDTEPPTAPTSLSASSLATDSLSLSWGPSTDNVIVSGYHVERGDTNAANFVEVASPLAPVSTYVDTGLTASTDYTYRVRADDGVNFSAYSSIIHATTLGVRTLTVCWIDQQDDGAAQETGFLVNRKTGAGGTWANITTTTASAGTGAQKCYVDTVAVLPTACYQVAATSTFGTSAYLGGDAGTCSTLASVSTHQNRRKGWRR